MASEKIHLPMLAGPLHDTHNYNLMRQCVHCGFCLPTCPTYAVLGVEMDSPRGRIAQMQAITEGNMEVSDAFIEHMNSCVGCRACETACPSGVQFGKLIEVAREHIHENQPVAIQTQSHESVTPLQKRPLLVEMLHRFFFQVMLPSKIVLSLVFGGLKIYQRSGLRALVHFLGIFDLLNTIPTPFQGKLAFPEALMDEARGSILPQSIPEITPAPGKRRYRVGFISGCIMDQVYRDINEATIRVLTANGCEVITPPQQSCCGALHVHGGEMALGRSLARHNIMVFEQYHCDAIIINSAGCGSTLKEYDHLLRTDSAYTDKAVAFKNKVKDISEFLVDIIERQPDAPVKRTVAYHDACHLLHGQKIKLPPRQLLQSIPGLSLVELEESDWCCGSAGIYNITQQEMGRALLERKMERIIETQADAIVTGNPGCMMQIALGAREHGLRMDVLHPVQLLDEAYQASGFYQVASSKNSQRIHPAFWAALVTGLIGLFLFLLRWRKRSR